MKVLTETGLEEANAEVRRNLARELPLSDRFSIISTIMYDESIPALFLIPMKVASGRMSFIYDKTASNINVNEKLAYICRAEVKMEEIDEIQNDDSIHDG